MVEALLARRWSPQQIAGVLRGRRWRISMQTIYRHIQRDRKRGGGLWRHTRIISKFGRKRYRSQDSRGVLPGKRHISERPAEANARARIGHWEGDTVMGVDQRHCLLTLVERRTGFVIIKKLPQRSKERACSAALQALCEHRGRFKTITVRQRHRVPRLQGARALPPGALLLRHAIPLVGARQQREHERTDQAVPAKGQLHAQDHSGRLQPHCQRTQ